MLEPNFNWHGPQDFMFRAWDFANGPENALGGATRQFQIKKYKLIVKCTVIKADARPNPHRPGEYVFNELVLDVDVDNAK